MNEIKDLKPGDEYQGKKVERVAQVAANGWLVYFVGGEVAAVYGK